MRLKSTLLAAALSLCGLTVARPADAPIKFGIGFSATAAHIIASGELYFTISNHSGEPFLPEGSDVLIMPLTNPWSHMIGCIKKHKDSTLVVDIKKSAGKGVHYAWAIYLMSTTPDPACTAPGTPTS